MENLYLGLKGSLHDVKCWICMKVERKDMLFTPKWYFLCKHESCMKVDKNIKTNVQKRDWHYSKVYRHVKNYKLHVFHNHESVVAQVANGLARER
jgi:hypothetical protein